VTSNLGYRLFCSTLKYLAPATRHSALREYLARRHVSFAVSKSDLVKVPVCGAECDGEPVFNPIE